MAIRDLEVTLDGASEQVLDIDATGVVTIEYPVIIQGSGYTEEQIKAMTNIHRNWAYIDLDNQIWMCKRSIGDADPTAWVLVSIPVNLSEYVLKSVYNTAITQIQTNLQNVSNVANTARTHADAASDQVENLTYEIGYLADLDTTEKDTIVGAINEVNGIGADAVSKIADVINDLSDAYSDSETYKVGQLCIHDNTLYRCKTAITTAEDWTPAHWTATTIAEEIENRVLWFPGETVSATNGTIVTKSDSRITPDHVLARAEFANSSSITALTAWSTDTAGTFTITGTCASATTVDIILIKKNN